MPDNIADYMVDVSRRAADAKQRELAHGTLGVRNKLAEPIRRKRKHRICGHCFRPLESSVEIDREDAKFDVPRCQCPEGVQIPVETTW